MTTCVKFPGADPFMDEVGLRSGNPSWFQIERALAEAPVGALALSAAGLRASPRCTAARTSRLTLLAGVFVLSKEFVRSKAPMRELSLALTHWEANREGRALVPVFLDVSWEECKMMRRRYDEPGFWDNWEKPDGWEKPEPTLLDEWATDLKRLSSFAGVRSGQVHCVWGFEIHRTRLSCMAS